jgi:hypothetical protein
VTRTDERKETEERERGYKNKKQSEERENVLLLEIGKGNKPLRK